MYSGNYVVESRTENEVLFLAVWEIKIEVEKILQVANCWFNEKLLHISQTLRNNMVSVHRPAVKNIRTSMNALRTFKSMYRIWMNAFRYLNDHHCKQDIHICLLSRSLKGPGLKGKKEYNDNKQFSHCFLRLLTSSHAVIGVWNKILLRIRLRNFN